MWMRLGVPHAPECESSEKTTAGEAGCDSGLRRTAPAAAPPAPCAALRPVLALLKSGDILVRGARVWTVAAQGALTATLDDGLAAHRARSSCRSVSSLLALERDLSPRMASAAVGRVCVLARMALQLGDEVAEPAQRFVALGFDLLDRAFRT